MKTISQNKIQHSPLFTDKSNRCFVCFLRGIPILLFLSIFFFIYTNSFARMGHNRLQKIVKVAVRAHSGVDKAIQKWSATIDYLSNSIEGYTFQILPLVTFKEMRKVVKNNEVEFVLTNPAAYIDLSIKYKVARIATLINGRYKNGYSEFGSVVFVKVERDDINLLSDIKNRSIMGVHSEAFGGWRMAYRKFLEIGINPFNDCSEILFSPDGTQEEVVYSVLQGKVDFGTVRTGILETMENEGKIKLNDLKIIEPKVDDFPLPHTTRLYPEWPFSVLKNTDKNLAKKVAIALLQMEKENSAAVSGGYTGWQVPLSYNQILLLLKILKVSPFDDIGNITTAEYIKQNWPWFILGCIIVSGLFLITIFVSRLNRKLNIRTTELEEIRSQLDQKVAEQTAELHNEIEVRKQTEEKLNKSNQLYAILSQVNQTIVREKDKQKLFQEICNIAIEFGRFRLAWIGLVDEEKKIVYPVAYSGEGSDYLQTIKISLDSDITGKGPTGRAIREEKSIIFNDLENNSDFAPWRKKALEKGYRSSAAFPLRLNDTIIGTFNVYAVEPLFFDEDEINLLEEAAMDISFALEKFEEEDFRRQTETALIESEKRLGTLLSNLPGMAYQCKNDEHWTMLFVNDACTQLTGYRPEQLINNKDIAYSELIHSEDRQFVNRKVNEALSAGTHFEIEYRIISAEGVEKWVWERGVQTVSQDQKLLEGVIHDITKRKQAEKALQESEEKFRTLIVSSPVGMFLDDAQGNAIYINNKCAELVGMPVEDALNMDWVQAIHPEDRKRVTREWAKAVKNGEEFHLEYRWIHKDGAVVWTLGDIVPVKGSDNEISVYIGTLTDITKRKTIDEALQKSNAQLRALSAHLQSIREDERTAISREIHDELGQILTVLKMDLSMMGREISEETENLNTDALLNEIKSMTGLIDTSIRQVRKLITKLRPEVLDNLGLIAALEWQGQEFQSRSKIKCKLESSIENINISGERAIALFRIFQEALTNIIRHAQATLVTVNISKKNNTFFLTIADNGIGITSDKNENKNTFGLLGMRERAIVFGGKVLIDSVAGNGTTITVSIPIVTEK